MNDSWKLIVQEAIVIGTRAIALAMLVVILIRALTWDEVGKRAQRSCSALLCLERQQQMRKENDGMERAPVPYPPRQKASCNWSGKNRGIEPEKRAPRREDCPPVRAGLRAILFIALAFNNSWMVSTVHLRGNIVRVCDSF